MNLKDIKRGAAAITCRGGWPHTGFHRSAGCPGMLSGRRAAARSCSGPPALSTHARQAQGHPLQGTGNPEPTKSGNHHGKHSRCTHGQEALICIILCASTAPEMRSPCSPRIAHAAGGWWSPRRSTPTGLSGPAPAARCH